jgi:hypothetical protein
MLSTCLVPTLAPNSSFHRIASRFDTAPGLLLKQRRLLQRVDAKYVLPAELAERVLGSIAGDYLLTREPEHCLAEYRTICFDTPDLLCYHEARRGGDPRHKIRIRQYVDLGEAFFEVKTERASGQTIKNRLPQRFDDETLTSAAKRLMRTKTELPVDLFGPSAVIVCHRMTLVNQRSVERVTVDFNIDFDGARRGESLQGIVILEVKQLSLMRETPVMRALALHDVASTQASKYCTAIALRDAKLPREHVQNFIGVVRGMQTPVRS